MKTMNKMTMDEWRNLRYPIQMQELSEEEGGGYIAWIPALGKGLFMVDADTAAEAIEELEKHRRSLYEVVVGSGRPIPLPDAEDEPMASGKWLQRCSRKLHAELKVAAAKDGVSFNTFCENALQRALLQESAEAAMIGLADKVCSRFELRVRGEARRARYEFRDVKGLPELDYESDYADWEEVYEERSA
jgi:hypothetical protein